MEVKIPQNALGLQALRDAWRLDLLGQPGWIGELSSQVAYKLYMGTAGYEGSGFPMNKDTEDALHTARAAYRGAGLESP